MEASSAHEKNGKNGDSPNVDNSTDESTSTLGASLEKRIQELEAQLKEKENKYVYLYAEFENFKKRTIKERSDLIKFGWESTARELLQTVDNLERALTHIPPQTDKNLVEGLTMVVHQFKTTLQKQGVQTIESLEKPFNPELHEAVGQEASTIPAGIIIKELSPGYTLHGRLLRASRVIISNGPESSET